MLDRSSVTVVLDGSSDVHHHHLDVRHDHRSTTRTLSHALSLSHDARLLPRS